MWYIEYLDEGTYMISAIQNADLHITSLGDSDIYLHTEADTSTHQWLIYHDAGGYRIQSYDMGPGMMTYTAPSTYVPNGRIEIDYPFTCQAKHYWNFVPVSNDLTLNEGAASTLSAAGISGTITWGSSNETVATVNASGVVTAVRAGRATVTASVNGAVQRTYNILVTIPDGQYLINHYTGAYYLTPDVISYADGTSLITQSRSTEKATSLSQIWNIQHQGNGYYTISTIYKADLRLTGFDSSALGLSTATSSLAYRWEIRYNTNGYEIVNNQYNTRILSPTSGTGYAYDGVVVWLEDYSSTDPTQRWQLTSITATGLMLLDSTTGERRDTNGFTEHVLLEIGGYESLSSLDLDLFAFGTSGTGTEYTITIADGTKATYYQASQLLYGVGSGVTTVTISTMITNVSYQISFPLRVCVGAVDVQLLYDNAYASRYPSNYLSRINAQAQALKTKYDTDLDIVINFNDAVRFQSYGDTCTSGSAYSNCTCGTCESSSVDDYGGITSKSYHHKNAANILVRLPKYGTTKTLAYIGHNVCYFYYDPIQGDYVHYVNGDSSGNQLYGLAEETLGVTEVVDHSDSDSSNLQHSTFTTIHEFGHLLGAPDHYNSGCPSTTALNALVEDSDPFDMDCIYGERWSGQLSDLDICDGCRQVIAGTLDLP